MSTSKSFTIGVDMGSKDKTVTWQPVRTKGVRVAMLEQVVESLPEQDSQVKLIAKDMLQEIREVETQSLSYPTQLMNDLEKFLEDNGVMTPRGEPLFPPLHHVNARHSITYL